MRELARNRADTVQLEASGASYKSKSNFWPSRSLAFQLENLYFGTEHFSWLICFTDPRPTSSCSPPGRLGARQTPTLRGYYLMVNGGLLPLFSPLPSSLRPSTRREPKTLLLSSISSHRHLNASTLWVFAVSLFFCLARPADLSTTQLYHPSHKCTLYSWLIVSFIPVQSERLSFPVFAGFSFSCVFICLEATDDY